MMIPFKIVNIVMTMKLGYKLDLFRIGKYPYVEFDLKMQRIIQFRHPNIKGKIVTIFKSGTLISVGATKTTDGIRDLGRQS